MQRVLSGELARHSGENVAVQGWIHRIRDLGGIKFLLIRDLQGVVQCVLDKDVDVNNEDVVEVVGVVRQEDRAPGGVEIQASGVKIVTKAYPTLPLEPNQKKLTASLDLALDHRALSLRNPRVRAAMKIQAELMYAFREGLRREGFTEINTPKIVSAGAEGGSAVFPVKYFDRTAFLAQSPQFYKQIMVGVFERVFEVAHVFRAEEHNTSRHLNEYLSLDYEMGFIENEHTVMDMEVKLLQLMFQHVQETCRQELEMYGARVPAVDPPRIPLAEAQEILRQKFGKEYTAGDDLDPEGERLICKHVEEETGSEMVFLTEYPVRKRPMYTMPHESKPGVTRSFDLLYKGLEITTGGQRIHDYDMLRNNIAAWGLDPADFEYYLEAFRYGMPPHGGLAIGAERLTARLLDMSNVREATLFPRDTSRLVP
ncbi:MAG TPA: aspartate--tRNA(Asn) ligase [Armatimonadota bacterium]|nr:aspartate--tRNA(Asn) ligase [Armatimonadota bacterium]